MAKRLCLLFAYLPKRQTNKLGFTKTLPKVRFSIMLFLYGTGLYIEL